MERFSAVAFLMCFSLVCAQIPRDSSFTDYSEQLKVRKKFPEAKLVSPAAANSIAVIENRVFTVVGKRELKLDAYLHKSVEKKPALILIHGGGWKSGDKRMMKPLATALAEYGYHSFAVEYRLSGEAQYPAGIDDVISAIHYVKANADEFNIDSAKIVVLGTSSGGQMASLIGTKYPDEVAAVINIDGILAFHHPDSEEGAAAAAWLGGTFDEKPEIWKDASALTHVNSKSAPVLFIGSQHKRFQAGREDMIKLLNNHLVYSQTQLVENSPHTFWMFEQWFDPVIGYITGFLNKQFSPQQIIQSK